MTVSADVLIAGAGIVGAACAWELAKAGGEWRILRRTCTLEWCRVNERAGWWDAPPAHRRGMRDRTDPVYWPWGQSFPWPMD